MYNDVPEGRGLWSKFTKWQPRMRRAGGEGEEGEN